ncbi:hypothetical protein ACQ4PT_037516 [Festuca glaucescens]
MGACSKETGSSEPLVVPPVQDDKTSEIPLESSTVIPPSPPPAASKPTTTPPVPPTKPLISKPSSLGKPLVAPGSGRATKKVATRKSTQITPSQLSGALQASMAPPSGSKAITIHVSKAAASINDKLVLHTGRITERTRSEDSLGSIEQYADAWNNADLTEVTSGLGKDDQPAIDPRGRLPIIKHLARLKRCLRDTDMAWYDVDKSVTEVLEARKKLYEDLLWEHRAVWTLSRHSKSRTANAKLDELVSCVAALQGEKENLSIQHQADLLAQKDETARLKEELIQLRLRHDTELKEAVKAGKTELEHAKNELIELHAREIKEVQDQLFKDLEAERKLRELERQRNNQLELVQIAHAKIIKDLDEKIQTTFPESQARAEAAVAKTRIEDPASDAAAWTTEEYITTLSAWVTYMVKLGKLPNAAIQVFSCLWPGEKAPNRVDAIAARLMECGARLNEWRRSAARSGADTALRFACSWHEGLDLDALATLHGGAPTDTDLVLTAKRRDRAYQVDHYAPTSTFIPAPADLEDEESGGDEEEEEAEETAQNEPANDKPATSSQAPESSSPDAPKAGSA